MTRRNTVHSDPEGEVPITAPRDVVALEFARRLQAAMAEKGWNQSELAREATKFMPEGKSIQRDTISVYINTKSMPSRVRLEAIAKALGVDSSELLPNKVRPVPSRVSPPLEVKDLGDGNVWLRINQSVPWPVALKILSLVKGEDAERSDADK